jgi:hypothetical protein
VGVLLGLAMVRVMDFWLCDKHSEHVDKN